MTTYRAWIDSATRIATAVNHNGKILEVWPNRAYFETKELWESEVKKYYPLATFVTTEKSRPQAQPQVKEVSSPTAKILLSLYEKHKLGGTGHHFMVLVDTTLSRLHFNKKSGFFIYDGCRNELPPSTRFFLKNNAVYTEVNPLR